jgi:glycosyltransferase involved in cell wall biosynthesis
VAWVWDSGAILVAAHRVTSVLERERPNLLVTKGLLCHFYGGLAARRCGIPCIWHIQDFISNKFAGVYRWVFGYMAAKLASRLIAIGSPILHQFPERLRAKTSVVHNGIDLQTFRPQAKGVDVRSELGIGQGEFVIGNVARLTPWKGQDLLLEAFARLVQQWPARLLLTGAPLFESEAYLHHLRDRTRELGLSDRVIFAGHRNDIPRVLAAIDVFAYTAVEKDVWPLSLLQAMAAGLPVAAFDIEGVREPIGSDENALLVPVACVEQFVRALSELAANENLRHRLSRAARRRAEEAFSVERYAAQMEAVFNRVLEPPE